MWSKPTHARLDSSPRSHASMPASRAGGSRRAGLLFRKRRKSLPAHAPLCLLRGLAVPRRAGLHFRKRRKSLSVLMLAWRSALRRSSVEQRRCRSLGRRFRGSTGALALPRSAAQYALSTGSSPPRSQESRVHRVVRRPRGGQQQGPCLLAGKPRVPVFSRTNPSL